MKAPNQERGRGWQVFTTTVLLVFVIIPNLWFFADFFHPDWSGVERSLASDIAFLGMLLTIWVWE